MITVYLFPFYLGKKKFGLFNKNNQKFVKGLNFDEPTALKGIPVYFHGLALLDKSKNWEILGRALITVKNKAL